MRNAFNVGPPVWGDDFFGRSALITSLTDSLTAGRNSTLLVGESRIGKTSLLRQLGHLTATNALPPVYFDGYAGGSTDRFAAQFGSALERAGGPLRTAAKTGRKGLHWLLLLLESLHDRLTILVDEVDSIVEDRESARFIRSAASLGHTIIIATSRIDPSHSASPSNEPPWWNVFRIQYVGLFDEVEARDMLVTLSERSGRRFADRECDFLLDVVGRFPFLLQWTGHEMFDRGFRECADADRRRLLEALAADFEFSRIIASHFHTWLARLDSSQTQLLLESASSRGISPNPAVANLKDRGLLVEDNSGRWHPFSRAFRHFLISVPTDPLLSQEAKAKLWQGLFPAIKTAIELAAKHYL